MNVLTDIEQVPGITSGVSAISIGPESALGTQHSCAIKDGAFWCWGDNTAGERGNNSTTSSRTPVAVAAFFHE